MVNLGSLPRLFAVTRPHSALAVSDLLRYTSPEQPLAWIRDDRGCVGIGEVVRLEFQGEDRFADASKAWRALSANATIDDPVGIPGSGLIAFGTFAFDDRSSARSVLIVPRTVVSVHEGRAWVTEISTRALTAEPELPARLDQGTWRGTDLATHAPAEAYLAGVRGATELIERGELEKIVMARRVTGSVDASDDVRVPLARLAERYIDCWTYAVDGMMGASPETLVRQTDGKITARVLAGTRGRRPTPEADLRERDELLGNAKEQHEHAFAVQSVITALAPHVQQLRTSEQPFALQLPNVWHLATDLEAAPSDGGSSLELTAALHPTAAVAGTPTHEAIEAISRLEPFDRERYAGAIGWIDARGDGEWVIALRCAQLGKPARGQRSVTAYAGGGIVAGSDPAHELRETVSKFRPIAEAFAR
ncbi:MAG: isochorismate synthase [Actinobacteria bacterium]|nr:isochorismate synthase [Actinomycetota bacterium]